MPRETYSVTIERPQNISIGQMKYYIAEAIAGWKGGCGPEEPIFYLAPCKVRRIPKPARSKKCPA